MAVVPLKPWLATSEIKLLYTFRPEAVLVEKRPMPLLPQPVVLVCLISLILLLKIAPPEIPLNTDIPVIVAEDAVVETTPAIVLLLIVKLAAF